MLAIGWHLPALRSQGGGGKARNRRPGTRRCRGTAATGSRAGDVFLIAGLSTLLLLTTAAAATLPALGSRVDVLQSDALLRALALLALIVSTQWLLMVSRRDWTRLAERERRAPGLLTSLGLDPRGAHADSTTQQTAQTDARKDLAQAGGPQPRRA